MATKLTKFQYVLEKDIDTLFKIVKRYHPIVLTKHKEQIKLNTYLKYKWLCIVFKIEGYGQISLRITNCDNHIATLSGSAITKKDMQNALDSNHVQFRVWRFADDKHYKIHEDFKEINCDDIFLENNYSLISAREWYRCYYSN